MVEKSTKIYLVLQERSILTYKASLKNMASIITKHIQRKKELAEQIKREETKVGELKSQLNEVCTRYDMLPFLLRHILLMDN